MTGGVTLRPLQDVTLLAGAPLQIPINANDLSGDPLAFSISSSNPAISASLPTANPDLVLNVTHLSSDYPGDISFSGTMIIELFPDQAPNTVAQIISLTNQGFYNGTAFYRVSNPYGVPFVIQGGAPTLQDANITIPQIDDEPNPYLRYASVGMMGMARRGPDTNTSDFFITADAEPFLDYLYTIFGRLVSGEEVRAKIQSVPDNSSNSPGDGQPFSPVTIVSATISHDPNDLALEVSAPVGTTGSGVITVTADDGHGGLAQQSFHVTVQRDPNDPPPFLLSVTPPTTTVNTPVSFQLPSFDLLGDPVIFFDPVGLQQFGIAPTQSISPYLHFNVNSSTGAVTVTPTNGLVGVQPMFFGVSESPTLVLPNTQMVPLFIDPAAPTGLALLPASDTGASNVDGITSLNNFDSSHELQFRVTGVTPGDTVIVMDGNRQCGSAVPVSSSVVVTTDGSHALTDGAHAITAKQILAKQSYTVGNSSGMVDLPSQETTPVAVVIDTVPPTVAIVSPGPSPLSAAVNQITLSFSEPVTGFDLASLALTANGGGNLLGSGQTLTTTDNQTFRLNGLTGVTSESGIYVLTLSASGSGITDRAGNPLGTGASTSFVVDTSLHVTNSLDNGPGSLRQALLDAAAMPGVTHTIRFTLPAGSQLINLATPLPTIGDPLVVVLDATQTVTVFLPLATAWNDNNSLTVNGPGTLTVRGGIDGTGNLVVSAGGTLTANHIAQNALMIGGAAGNVATLTIAASDSDASPDPRTAAATGTATDATISSPRLAVPTSDSTLVVAAASVASTLTTSTMTGSTTARSSIPVAEASNSQATFHSALAAERISSNLEGPVVRQSSVEFVGMLGLAFSKSDEMEWSLSLTRTGDSSTSNQAISLERRTVVATNGTGDLFHRDALAAAFDDAERMECVDPSQAARPRVADADTLLMADDLLDAIGYQWRN